MNFGPRNCRTRIYALLAPERNQIKIGFTRCIGTRIATLQGIERTPLIFLAEVPGGRQAERRVHEALAPFRVRGEWFANCAEVMKVVAEMRKHPSRRVAPMDSYTARKVFKALERAIKQQPSIAA